MTKATIVAAFMLVVGTVASSATTATKAENEAIEAERERIQLYTACAPMDFLVESLDPEGSQRTGLTRKTIENAVEARLRAARLFTPTAEQPKDKEQYLYINLNIIGHAFSIDVELTRYLKDLGYGFGGFAIVWDTGSTGTHGGVGQYILGSVSKHLDRFIASYLRVNEAHCSR